MSHNRSHFIWSHLHEMSRIDKFIEPGNRLVVVKGRGGWEGWLRGEGFLWGKWIHSLNLWWWLYNSMNMQDTIDRYSLNEWIMYELSLNKAILKRKRHVEFYVFVLSSNSWEISLTSLLNVHGILYLCFTVFISVVKLYLYLFVIIWLPVSPHWTVMRTETMWFSFLIYTQHLVDDI